MNIKKLVIYGVIALVSIPFIQGWQEGAKEIKQAEIKQAQMEQIAAIKAQDKIIKARYAERLNAIKNHKIALGFLKDEVKKSWGAPENVNTTISAAFGKISQWCYSNGAYVYFKDGQVIEIQN